MARPTKIDPILRDLEPSQYYTVAEIVLLAGENGNLALVYPELDIKQATARAKKAVFSHIHRRKLTPAGKKNDQLAYRGSDFPCRAKIEDEILTEVAKHGLALVPRKRFQQRWWALAAGLCIVLLTVQVYHIAMASGGIPASLKGDVAGLRAFNREHVVSQPAVSPVAQAKFLSDIQRDFGQQAQYDVQTIADSPYRELVAEAVAQAQDEILVFQPEDLVAVFAHWEEPMWVVSVAGVYRPIRLGDWVQARHLTGYVTRVGHNALGIRTETGAIRSVARPDLVLFGRSERHSRVSLVYPREEGNLGPLLTLLATLADRPYEDHSLVVGQVAGFLPPVTNLEELVFWLARVGVSLQGETVVLASEPRLKLAVGFHAHSFSLTAPESLVLQHFADIAPVPVHIQLNHDEQVWYTGQSLLSTLRDRNILVGEGAGTFSFIR